ncbi:MAG: hypothetical protein AAB074_15460 [Planctomycetota bacterium]
MRASLVASLVLLSRLAFAGDDEEILACDSADGFQTALPGGDKPAEAELKAEGGHLVLGYERSKMAPLANYALLTELKELRLRIRSDETGTWVVVLKDRDGATWNQPFRLVGGAWTDVTLEAGKFALNADSAVKKERLDSARLGTGWVMLDAAAIVGNAKGRNELRVDEVRVVRAPIDETTGEWVVETEQLVATSRKHTGRITVKKPGKLTVTAPRFVAGGEISLQGGIAEFRGGVVDILQRFQHERDVRLSGEARLSFHDALVFTHFPAGLKLDGAQTVAMTGVECIGGFTGDVPPKAKILLSKTKNPGEFVIAPGGTVEVSDCENVILWHTFGANLTGAMRFPGPDVGANWKSGHGLNVSVERSKGVKWTLLSLPDAAGSVEDCNPMAVGLLFGHKTALTIDDLQNGRAMAEWRVPAPDRALVFRNATVGAWNIYASDDAVVRLRKSTIGEAMTFGKGRIELEDSTVDGKGGYVGAHDDSVIRLVRCKITCLVVARTCSRIELVECDVTGDVRAVEAGHVKLTGTSVSGKTQADDGGVIER